MTKYIEDTLAALDLKILMLQKMRENLERTFRDWTIEVEGPGPEEGLKVEGCRLQVAGGKEKATGVRKAPGGKRGESVERILAVGRRLGSRFTTKELQDEALIPKSSAGSTIQRWVKRGWIRKVGHGTYERSEGFGGGNGDGPRPHPSPLPSDGRGGSTGGTGKAVDRGTLEGRLKNALKQRDHARENGRDTIAEIFQKDIEKLEREMEKADTLKS